MPARALWRWAREFRGAGARSAAATLRSFDAAGAEGRGALLCSRQRGQLLARTFPHVGVSLLSGAVLHAQASHAVVRMAWLCNKLTHLLHAHWETLRPSAQASKRMLVPASAQTAGHLKDALAPKNTSSVHAGLCAHTKNARALLPLPCSRRRERRQHQRGFGQRLWQLVQHRLPPSSAQQRARRVRRAH